MTLRQLDYHRKAIAFLNINGFFEDLFRQFDTAIDQGFIKPEYKEMYYVADNIADLINYIQNYQVPVLPDKWFAVQEVV